MAEQEVREKAKAKPSKSSALRTIRTKQVVLVIGTVALIVTSLLFLFGSLFSVTRTGSFPFVTVKSGYPQLHDVCLMQRYYVHDGKVIGRDTQPISPRDFRLLVDERVIPPYYVIWTEEAINKHPFIDYHPMLLIEMHDNFKGGLEFSYHFNEKYDKLVFYYWARLVVFGVLMVIALIVLIIGFCLPKHVEDIGERGGEHWE